MTKEVSISMSHVSDSETICVPFSLPSLGLGQREAMHGFFSKVQGNVRQQME